MMPDTNKNEIFEILDEESTRIQFGKIMIEVTVLKGICTNIQFETKRSVNINNNEKPK